MALILWWRKLTGSRKRAKLARLLNAAEDVVCEHGLGGLTVERVCARAVVATRTFHGMFASPEHCLLALFDRTADELRAVAKDARDRHSEWAERARAGMDALLSELEANPWKADLVFGRPAKHDPGWLDGRVAPVRKMAALLEDCVGVSDGAASPVRPARSDKAPEPLWLRLLYVIGAKRELSTRAIGRLADLGSERQRLRLLDGLANLGLAEDTNANDPRRRRSAWRLTDLGMEWLSNVR